MKRLSQLRMKLVQEPGLAQARFADDQHELAFARPGTLPTTSEQAQFFLAADEGRQNPSAAPPTAAAGANDTKELDRFDYVPIPMKPPV